MKAYGWGFLIVLAMSSLITLPAFGQGKGGGNRGRAADELPFGLNQYEETHPGKLPSGLERQVEEEGNLPSGLEAGGKKLVKKHSKRMKNHATSEKRQK
jgi:hypothetical protein